jgi:membrane-bound lytic murein transglycosylase D
MMCWKPLLFILISLFAESLALALPIGNVDPLSLGSEGAFLSINPPLKFQVDQRMRKNVDFWIRIYTEFSSNQGLIHDSKYIDHVYEILDFKNETRSNSKVIKTQKKKWKEILLSVHKKQTHAEKMTDDEKRVFELFRDVDEPNKFLNAAHRKRLRFQLGQKDRFLDGLYQSGRFLPMMEVIFKKEGMPLELTRLPFVESSFNIKARSKVGASGIWQFMRSTAKLFMKITPAYDERNDPIRATEGAAKLLRLNYESLQRWPLAVTAYNHGRKGMMRAVRKVGSEELGDLVSDYHSRSFGFASSNFFTELLAAIEVEKNAEKYFGKIPRAALVDYFEVELPDFIGFRDLAQEMALDVKAVKDLNPGLSESVFTGSLLIPRGYRLRLPRHAGPDQESGEADFQLGYSKIDPKYKLAAQRLLNYGTSDQLGKKAKKSRKGSLMRKGRLLHAN